MPLRSPMRPAELHRERRSSVAAERVERPRTSVAKRKPERRRLGRLQERARLVATWPNRSVGRTERAVQHASPRSPSCIGGIARHEHRRRCRRRPVWSSRGGGARAAVDVEPRPATRRAARSTGVPTLPALRQESRGTGSLVATSDRRRRLGRDVAGLALGVQPPPPRRRPSRPRATRGARSRPCARSRIPGRGSSLYTSKKTVSSSPW